jgi:hypothetical protein
MYFLTAGAIQQELVNRGSHTLETVPSVERLHYFLEVCQIQITDWLGYNPMRKVYTDRVSFQTSNWRATLTHQKVRDIRRITVKSYSETFEMDKASIAAVWVGGQIVNFEAIGNLYLPWYSLYWRDGASIEIEYEAGSDQVSRGFQLALVETIAAALEHGIPWLSEPVADIQNIGMAGVSKSIRLGKGAEKQDGTNLDRILSTYLAGDRKVLYY